MVPILVNMRKYVCMLCVASVVGEIVNPLALPMYRNDHSNPRKRAMEKKDPIR